MFIERPYITINIGVDLPEFQKINLDNFKHNIIKQCQSWLSCHDWNTVLIVNFTDGIRDRVIYSDQLDPDCDEIEQGIYELIGTETYYALKQVAENN